MRKQSEYARELTLWSAKVRPALGIENCYQVRHAGDHLVEMLITTIQIKLGTVHHLSVYNPLVI